MKKTHRQNGVRWATASIALLAMNILLPSALLLATAADHPALVLSRHLSSPTIDRLNQALKSYQLLEADLPLLAEEARTQGRIHVVMEGIPHDLLLEVNNLYAPGIRWTMTTDSGVFDMPVPPPTTYRGSVDGETDSQLRLLIQGDLLLGFIRRGNDYLFIEPLSKYLPGARAGQLVAYHEDDVRPESAALCGTEGIHILARQVGGPPLSDKSDHFASVTFRRLQVASDADFEFFTIHNNTSAAFTNSYIAGILNQVDGIYHTDLNLGVSITFQNVYTTSSNPYTSSIANTLLNQFVTNWNNTRSGVTRDVAHLFSGKSLNSGIVGISYVGAACFTSAAYGLTSDYQPYTMKVSAHEIAHNLGAEHDDQSPAPILPCPGNGWLMCAYIQPSGPNDFSQKTKDAVSSYVASSATSTCLSILAGTPVVNTDAATNVQSTTATLNATVNPTGSSTSVYFQYGTTITNGSPVYGSTTSTQPIGSGSSNVAVVSPLTGLSANSTYHYQAVAINSAGTVYGNDATFATGAPATAPTVTTSPATGVQSTSATLNGTVNPNNASTTCYFQWGLTTAYGNTTSVQNAGSGSSIFNATQPISGLSSNTTYHYRLVATNSAGMTNGSDVAFTTALPITPPTVTTNAASSIQSGSATLNGIVNPNGSATTGYFNWGLTTAYGNSTSAQSMGSGSAGVPFSAAVSGLSPNITYHFQAVGNNAGGTVLGSDVSFTTPLAVTAPTVTTSPATGVQSTSATLNGTVNPNNASTTCYFQWGLTTAYGNTTSVQNAGSGSSIFNATQPISGLSSNTTYHYRLVATNSAGMTNGSDVAFTTALPITPPTVTTNAASSIQSGSATLNGIVNPNGSATTGYFNWGLTTAYGNSTSAQSMGSGSAGVPFSAAVSGLSANTTYHFQAVGNNAGGTVLGSDVSFTTPLAITPPIVTTLAATSVIAGSATLNGSVNPNGVATTAYFQWGTTTSYGNSTAGQLLPAGSSTLPLSAIISGLQSNMTYHYQIVAVNGAGTSYGNDISFTTPMCAFTVSFSTQSFLAVGGSGTATVTASASDCSWTAGSNVSWMTIDSGSAGTGNGVVRYSVAGNPSPVLRTGQLTAAGKSILVAQSGSTSIGFDAALPAGSVISRYSQGQGPLSVTYGVITASTTSPPVALANFGWAANGVLVTEVGIPASSTMTSTRLFVDYSNTHNSGIGIVNPNNVSLNMLLTLRNQSGSIVSTASLSLGPAGHTAKFVNELGLILPNPFLGTLTISGDVPFAAVNLRTSVNGHGETLFSALPLVDLNNIPISSSLIFPQVLDGGGSPTQILLMNPSDIFSAAGRVAIFDDNGNPLALDFGPGLGVLSTLDYSMSPSGMLKFSTTGLGPLRVGYIIVTPTFGALPVGGAIFSMSGTAGVASQAGVLNTLPGIDERLFIDVAATPLARNTGIAVVNNNVTTANLNLNLAGIDGSTHSGTLTIVPNGHVAKFITELFSGLPANFQGIMTITSNVPIAPLLLRLTTNQRGETIASTLPAAGPGSSTSYPLIIPQIVDGGGYQTQLIILNLATGPGQIHIDFLNDSGVYVILPLN
jgi:hypothetical protein